MVHASFTKKLQIQSPDDCCKPPHLHHLYGSFNKWRQLRVFGRVLAHPNHIIHHVRQLFILATATTQRTTQRVSQVARMPTALFDIQWRLHTP
eukprot:CAMPEP_0179441402 /NCGR_PEP_ID=MMETSP0799-20121207/24965_1 /TAXON_ID=46947 /ORGANISM="Geminigera cryophila, Strain CCMP2564" /LENGTH=92 /DNA_ID=CAMNT_0021225643 /DNA_START=309 /DNA_END=583 /DNA_ORIENTATION=-